MSCVTSGSVLHPYGGSRFVIQVDEQAGSKAFADDLGAG